MLNTAHLTPHATPPLPGLSRSGFFALGAPYVTEQPPAPVPSPHWVAHSPRCAEWLGWDGLDFSHALSPALLWLSGNAPEMRRPLASVYSGHQFGVWAGQLGDGRALNLGVVNSRSGPLEVQLKGAGPTPYSRMGDGRAVLRSSIREFLCSEAMHGLGIPTTRALCVVGSPLPVRREDLETAAIVTRVAPSFLRFGHFEHFSHTAPDAEHRALRVLADHLIDTHYPSIRDEAGTSGHSPYAALLKAIAGRTAELLAQWQAVGFCHGVMNTDNMSCLGLTLDYGPFGFLDGFNPHHICNHSDHQGRYSFARQPQVAMWNLHALAQALMPLIGESDLALEALQHYQSAYPRAITQRLRAKLGLASEQDSDTELIDDWLRLLARHHTDYTLAHRRLALLSVQTEAPIPEPLRDLFLDRDAFDAWAMRYRLRLQQEASVDAERRAGMNAANPKFILRNHLAQTAIGRAREGDFTEVQRLLKVLEQPFDEQCRTPGQGPGTEADAGHPPEWAQHIEVSCSS